MQYNVENLNAAIGVTTASSVNALRLGKDVLYHVPPITAGYTIAMSLFCVFQESLRSVRGGRHDALNSGLAGAAAASISVKVLQGSKYHRLAAIVWGPLCAASHALNELLQPRKELEDLLISANLLHPSVA
ncbi:hypothetical protein QJQ45_007276, partial [Haematococcus lacustris]